jgi:hypothetical protein
MLQLDLSSYCSIFQRLLTLDEKQFMHYSINYSLRDGLTR